MQQVLKTFEELDCYRKSRSLRIELARVARTLPAEERFRLADQLIRAARSITANIAEGFGRHHHTENLQYCRQARGSLTECLDHLNAALDEQLMSETVYQERRLQLEEAWRVLNGYIAYLKRCVKSGVPAPNSDALDN